MNFIDIPGICSNISSLLSRPTGAVGYQMDEENLEELELNDLLETGLTVHVKINTGNPNVIIPTHLKNRESVVLEIGYNLAVPIPDLELTERGISCTLSFNRTPFTCYVPWESIMGYGGDAVAKLLKDFEKGLVSHTDEKLDIKKPISNVPKDSNGKVIRPSWLTVVK